MNLDFDVVLVHLPELLNGLGLTLRMTALILVIGLATGLVLAFLRMSAIRAIAILASVYIDFFRTTPPLVQIIWAYFALPLAIGTDINAFEAGVIALGLNGGAFMAEIYRSGIQSIDQGQRDAAHVLGLKRLHTLTSIVMPQALRVALPALLAQGILLFKETPLVGALAVLELTYTAGLVALDTSRPTEIYLVIAIMYFSIVTIASLGTSQLERRLRVSER